MRASSGPRSTASEAEGPAASCALMASTSLARPCSTAVSPPPGPSAGMMPAYCRPPAPRSVIRPPRMPAARAPEFEVRRGSAWIGRAGCSAAVAAEVGSSAKTAAAASARASSSSEAELPVSSEMRVSSEISVSDSECPSARECRRARCRQVHPRGFPPPRRRPLRVRPPPRRFPRLFPAPHWLPGRSSPAPDRTSSGAEDFPVP